MIKGSSSALTALHERIRRIGTPSFQIPFGRALGDEAVNQFVDGFDRSRDPYGKAWEPLKYGHGRPLVNTGRLANSASATPVPSGFSFRIGESYGEFHQLGTERIPVRQMVPMASTGGVGPIWGAALNRVANDFLRDYLGGA
jgi:phage gpG-like protein